jgi:hypothetical protein
MGNVRQPSPDVYFEAGIHPLSESSATKSMNQTLKGNESVHVWNEAVRKRIGSYSPDIIAIDSLLPVGIDQTGGMNFYNKALVWNFMPGRPSELNGTDEIFVIAGDNTYNFPNPNDTTDSALRFGGSVGYVAMAYSLGIAIDKHVPGRKQKPLIQKQQPKKSEIYDWKIEDGFTESTEPYDWATQETLKTEALTSRRKFFRLGLGALTIAAVESTWIAAYSPWRTIEKYAEEADTAVESVSLQRVVDPDHLEEYLTGRTALLIAKTNDAINMMNSKANNRGSVVMGSEHSYQANDLLRDPEMRYAYMRRHTELMLEYAKKSKAGFDGHWTSLQRQQWVMKNETSMQIFRVLEPDPVRFKADPKAEIDRVIQLHETINSPSASAAIDGLLKIPGII